jgi:RHS repeat-associated protein
MGVVAKTVLGKAQIATRKSGHFAPGPPAANLAPPTPPAGPVPAPFLYIAKTSTGHSGTLADETVCKGATCLVASSAMDVERPGNMPTQPVKAMGGTDIVTHVVVGQARMLSGSAATTAKNGEKVCKTGDPVALNVPMPSSKLHQSEGVLVLGLVPGMSDAAKKKALEEAQANAAIVTKTGDPVAVTTGEVLDDVVDLALPGLIPVAWSRHYRSRRDVDGSLFGRGGWTHGLDTRLVPQGSGFVLLQADGSRVPFDAMPVREERFQRASRLVLRRTGAESYEVRSLDTRLVRELAPLRPGGPAMLRGIRDAWGNRVELFHDGERLTTIVDTARRELRLEHDTAGRVTRVALWARGVMWQEVRYAYAEGGELAVVTNALGHCDHYSYDGAHRLREKRLRGGLTVRFEYDEDGRCVRSATPEGIQRVTLHFDDEEQSTLVHENPEPVLYTWDARGIVVRAETTDGSLWSEYVYDADLYLLEGKHSGGRSTLHTYDPRGNRVAFVDFAGRETHWEYSADDLPTRRSAPQGETRCDYDPRGALVAITYPTGNTFTRTPDAWGRLVAVDGPEGRVLTFEHDAEHNVVKEIDARGAVTTNEHDALGRIVKRVDPLGRVMRREYDALGRPTLQTFVDGTVLRYEWDEGDHLVRNTDAHGHVLASEPCGTGVVQRRTMPDGQAWRFDRDILERVRAITNPRGETCEFSFDRAGRVIEQKTFDGRLLSYQYSPAGAVSRVEHPNDDWVTFARDPLGRVVVQASPHGTRTFGWTDDHRVRESAVDDPDGPFEVKNEHDARGRLVASHQGDLVVKYEHDALGRVSARLLPGGHVTRYHWDVGGALTAIDHDGHKVLLQRDILGRLVRLYAYDSGLDVLLGYAECGRFASQDVVVHGSGTARAITRRRWRYGAHARMMALSDTRWGNSTYEHDAAGRLLGVHGDAFTERYEYDGAGYLRGSAEGGDAPTPWQIGLGNVLLATPQARFENDARHRRKRVHHADGRVTKLLWDAFDQLREVVTPDGTRVCFRYDGLGRRVQKTVIAPLAGPLAPPSPPRTVRYLWDGDELAAEIDSERGMRVFVSEPGSLVPLLQVQGGEVFVCVTGHLGAPRELVDGQGHLAWAAATSPWGRVLSVARDERHAKSDVASPFRLLGHYHDEETGLSYARFRYFDPETKRWLSPDPLEIEGGGDLFGFEASPTERVDPLGLKSRTEMEEFLAATDKARAEAHAAAMAEQQRIRDEIDNNDGISDARKPFVEAQCTSGAKSPHAEGAPPPAVGRNDPGGTGVHAEENIGPLGGTAVGAGRPHCANCVAAIQAGGGVTASPIRSSGKAAWDPPPATPAGQTPTQDPAW